VIELVELAVTAGAPSTPPPFRFESAPSFSIRRRLVRFPAGDADVPVVDRASMRLGESHIGPAVIEEPDSTVLLEAGDALTVLADGVLSIDVEREESDGNPHR
jgi:N-methylhydantoinase A/oxoprolinase/acetone carboxylase beta subunit